MSNQNLTAVIGIIALVLGTLLGATAFAKTETEYLPGEDSVITEYVNQTVEVEVPSVDAMLEQAIADAEDELSDNDGFLTCKGEEYDSDEFELSRVKQWAYVWFDEDEYDVGFEAKYTFDSTDDDDKCSATYKILVHYEDGEKPEVSVL